MPPQTINERKKELEEERDKIKAILARRAKKDPKIAGNYVTKFPDTDTESPDIDDEVFEEEEYELDVDIEHVLEKRLKVIDAELKKIEEELAR